MSRGRLNSYCHVYRYVPRVACICLYVCVCCTHTYIHINCYIHIYAKPCMCSRATPNMDRAGSHLGLHFAASGLLRSLAAPRVTPSIPLVCEQAHAKSASRVTPSMSTCDFYNCTLCERARTMSTSRATPNISSLTSRVVLCASGLAQSPLQAPLQT